MAPLTSRRLRLSPWTKAWMLVVSVSVSVGCLPAQRCDDDDACPGRLICVEGACLSSVADVTSETPDPLDDEETSPPDLEVLPRLPRLSRVLLVTTAGGIHHLRWPDIPGTSQLRLYPGPAIPGIAITAGDDGITITTHNAVDQDLELQVGDEVAPVVVVPVLLRPSDWTSPHARRQQLSLHGPEVQDAAPGDALWIDGDLLPFPLAGARFFGPGGAPLGQDAPLDDQELHDDDDDEPSGLFVERPVPGPAGLLLTVYGDPLDARSLSPAPIGDFGGCVVVDGDTRALGEEGEVSVLFRADHRGGALAVDGPSVGLGLRIDGDHVALVAGAANRVADPADFSADHFADLPVIAQLPAPPADDRWHLLAFRFNSAGVGMAVDADGIQGPPLPTGLGGIVRVGDTATVCAPRICPTSRTAAAVGLERSSRNGFVVQKPPTLTQLAPLTARQNVLPGAAVVAVIVDSGPFVADAAPHPAITPTGAGLQWTRLPMSVEGLEVFVGEGIVTTTPLEVSGLVGRPGLLVRVTNGVAPSYLRGSQPSTTTTVAADPGALLITLAVGSGDLLGVSGGPPVEAAVGSARVVASAQDMGHDDVEVGAAFSSGTRGLAALVFPAAVPQRDVR